MAEIMFGDEGRPNNGFPNPKPVFGKKPMAMVTTSHGTHLVEEMLIQVSEGMSF
jgi:hypothetical protein